MEVKEVLRLQQALSPGFMKIVQKNSFLPGADKPCLRVKNRDIDHVSGEGVGDRIFFWHGQNLTSKVQRLVS